MNKKIKIFMFIILFSFIAFTVAFELYILFSGVLDYTPTVVNAPYTTFVDSTSIIRSC